MSHSRSYQFDDATRQYKDKIQRNGGSISFSSLLRLDRELVRPLKSSGLWGQIRRLNPCLGNDLTTSLVPLIFINGSSTDTNTGLVAADYSEATGWTGDGTVNKFIDTGFVQGTTGTGGMAAYLRTTQANSATVRNGVMGCQDTASAQIFRIVSNTNGSGVVTSGASAGSFGGNLAYAATTFQGLTAGFWNVTRVSSTNVALYQNGGLVSASSTSTTLATTVQTCTILSIKTFGAQGLPLNSGSKVAGYCFDSGLSISDAMTLANIWQRFQVSMNRNV